MIVFILTATDATARVMTTIIPTTMKGTAAGVLVATRLKVASVVVGTR